MLGKSLLRTVMLASALLLSAAPVSLLRAEEPKPGGSLIIGAETDIGTRDPAVSESGAAARVNQLVFEGLVARDYTVDTKGAPPPIIPVLATSWDVSDDGLQYTFHLRPGVKFHDGTPFNADAVVFNVRRVWDPKFEFYNSRGAGIPQFRYLYLKGIEAKDDATVVFTLSQRNAFFIDQLAEGASPGLPTIASPTSIKTYGNDDVGNHPAGTGPFKVTEQVKGEYITLDKNPDYWNKPYPYLDQLIFRQIPDSTTRVNALRAGEVDLIISVPPDDVEPLKGEGYTVAMGPLPHIWYVDFNAKTGPFANQKVRQAVSMAIDKEGMARELLRGTAKPSFSMVSSSSPAYDPNWKEPYPYDPVKAKALLAEAGYPDGFKTVYEESTSGSGQIMPVQMAEWIQRDLRKIGVDVTLQTYEWNTYLGRWLKGLEDNVGMNQQSWGSNSDFWLQVPLQSKSWGNSGHVNDAEVDTMLTGMIGATDQKARIDLARKLAERDMEQAYHLPVVSDMGAYAMASKVKGFIRAADWIESYNTIWISE
ncbi:peptide ABC transporter substrate-binding protein [Kaistia sp. 32K]|uniref:ABC transporter substrate-binding protein n=1 Tax=Kaistia sp. 32K TaxID=2795690 RepID=UPI001915299E|nr:ABC transporter substrate-binding protein [Kaistia sp. 32K]BCP53995.1 peptide ABC transporter substrate-binding protein [Kaistia sp. 32K]